MSVLGGIFSGPRKFLHDILTGPRNDNQFAACVSCCYNIGCSAFKRSTVARMARQGKHRRAQAAFAMWVFAGGKKLRGLVRRRAAEAKLYGTAP